MRGAEETPGTNAASNAPRALTIVLKRASGDATDARLTDVDATGTIGELKARRVVAALGAADARDVTLVHAGRVLRDDEETGRALRCVLGADREYVVHAVVREDAVAVGGGGADSVSGGDPSTRSADAREGRGGGGGDGRALDGADANARDPGTPAVFARAGPSTPAMSATSARRADAGDARGGGGRASSTSIDASRVASGVAYGSAVELAASPLINATYQAAYHAAYAALSPTQTPPPGPPPLRGFGNFLASAAVADSSRATEHNGGSTATNEREVRRGDGRPENAYPPELNIPPGARVRVIHIRIDLKLILKLGMMVFFLSQDASAAKIALYVAVAVFVYLQQTGALAPLARWAAGNERIGNRQNGGRADERGRNGNEQGDNGGGANERFAIPTRATHAAGYTTMPQSYFGEVKIFFYSFFASIFPSWLPPRLRAEREQRARPHQD